MSFWFDLLGCGIVAALVWAGLVGMSADRPIVSSLGWVQGMGIVAIANGCVWFLLSVIALKMIWVWAIALCVTNMAIGWLILVNLDPIQIPPLWSIWLHPLAIATMIVLLAGALGKV